MSWAVNDCRQQGVAAMAGVRYLLRIGVLDGRFEARSSEPKKCGAPRESIYGARL